MLTSTQPQRIAAIDILRALTMVLMIFVNDLWSLRDIPEWLLHVPASADGMGLSDVIFPAFLFIVGMSVPFAVSARRKKGDSDIAIAMHVAYRSGILLIMGLFFVNGESINEEATGMHRLLWNTAICTAFILIWNSYPSGVKVNIVRAAKAIGIITLLILAFLYRGGEAGSTYRFTTHWWGILGLIGWAYLISAIVYVFLGKQLKIMIAAWIILIALSMASQEDWPVISAITSLLNLIGGASHAALTMGGVVTSMIYIHSINQNKQERMLLLLPLIGLALIAIGFYTRNFWDISKIRATPPWVLICSGITLLAFVAIYWVADRKGKAHWFNVIKPAGSNTLLCYLMPYFAYALMAVLSVSLPDALLVEVVGLLKSFLFALLVVTIVGWLGKRGVQLKL